MLWLLKARAMKTPDSKKLVVVTLCIAGAGEGHTHETGGFNTLNSSLR